MKRAFVRGLWGDIYPPGFYPSGVPMLRENDSQLSKIQKDIKKTLDNPYTEPFVTYIFGLGTAESLNSILENSRFKDSKTRVIHSKHTAYDMKTKMWRHKLDILKAAMQEYDEVVFLDWDVEATKPLPDDFWDQMKLRKSFQANLYQYRTKKCLWRDSDWRKTCNGGFIYIADKSIPEKLIAAYDKLDKWVSDKKEERESQGKSLRFREKSMILDDEPSMSHYIDGLYGGFPGADFYWENHEPMCCNVKKSAYSRELCDNKEACFKHWV